jgi:hypothetical protein
MTQYTELIESGVTYATPADVSRYVRNKEFSPNSDPTESEVRDLLLEASNTVDKRTRRAWRLRERREAILRVEWPHDIEAAHQRRRRRSTRHGFVRPLNKWGIVNLDRARIHEVTRVVALLPEDETEITSEQGRDGAWWYDGRQGAIYVGAEEFMVGPLRGSGLLDPARLEVDFQYGNEEAGGTTQEAVSDAVPADLRTATAKLVAADLLESDQYGSMVASGPEGVPDQNQAAQRFRDQAHQAIDTYRIKKVM